MSKTIQLPERIGVAAAASLGWLPVAAFWIYSKQIRIHDRYFPLLSAYSGINGKAGILDRLELLLPDLVFALFLIPCAIFLSHFYAPRSRSVRWSWVSFSFFIAILLFANLHSWGTVGRFLTGTALVNAVTFAMEQPQMMDAYIGIRGLSKLALILAASLGCFFALTRLWRWTWLRWVCAGLPLLVSTTALAVAVCTLSSPMANLPITRDFVYQALLSLADFTSRESTPNWSDDELADRFEQLTKRTQPERSPFFGSAAGNDLVVFILETGSSRFVDLVHDLDSFPTAKRLSPRSAIATAHSSVFPATSESVFSIITGAYPARSLYNTCIVDQPQGKSPPFDGFVSALRSRGYHTAAYLPFTSVVPLDKALLGNIGLDKLFYAQQHLTPPTMGRDRHALLEMRTDIERLIDQDRRYVAIYLPQIGHAPWPDRPSGRSVQSHGKHVAQVQDQWLGEVVDLLARKGRLDKTIIIVTGDHGIRTTSEDQDFASGLIDSYSFSVPLLIYSPDSFSTNLIDGPTSHIDVSPTILDLFGIEPLASHQGSQIWDANLHNRRQFFLANWYFGADGLRDGKEYYMYSDVLGLAFASDALTFSTSQVLREKRDSERIKTLVDQLYLIQQRWIEKHMCR